MKSNQIIQLIRLIIGTIGFALLAYIDFFTANEVQWWYLIIPSLLIGVGGTSMLKVPNIVINSSTNATGEIRADQVNQGEDINANVKNG